MAAFTFDFSFPEGDGAIATGDATASSEGNASDVIINSSIRNSTTKEERKGAFMFLENVSERLVEFQKMDLAFEDVVIDGSSGMRLRMITDQITTDNSIKHEIEQKKTDIIPGKYEGGLKLWECSVDLCKYLLAREKDLCNNGAYVLELGCGHGLPGCLLLRNALVTGNEIHLLFSDMNDFVLQDCTLANVFLNTNNLVSLNKDEIMTSLSSSVSLGAGDWLKMSHHLSQHCAGKRNLPLNGRFDLILAAETTYTLQSAKETAILLSKHLLPTSGVGLLAMKRYYFGCGGGVDAFRSAAAEQIVEIKGKEYSLAIETLETFDSGTTRELLQVRLCPI